MPFGNEHIADNPPFAGEFPTYEEVMLALKQERLAMHAQTVVRMMWTDQVRSLAEGLTLYRSDALTPQWPRMFRMVVMGTLAINQGESPTLPPPPRTGARPRPRPKID